MEQAFMMNFSKKYSFFRTAIIFIFLLNSSLIFSQDFNDKLFTKNGNVISCQIKKFVHKNVFFLTFDNEGLIHENIAELNLKKIILSNTHSSRLILKKKNDSLVTLDGYGSLMKSEKLILEKTKNRGKQIHQKQVTFKIGQRIKITKNNNEVTVGKIEYIADSTILLKQNSIKTKEIKKITKGRGGTILFTGLSIAVFASTIEKIRSNGSNYGGDILLEGFLIVAVDVILTVPLGIVLFANTKHYRMDKGWKITTSK